MSQTRINTTATFAGGFVLPNSDAGFPANPRIGQFFTKDFQLYAYLRIGDLQTWYPLAARTRSFVHSQAQASTTWLVQHNLGSSDVWFTAYSASGIEIVNKENIDANSFRLHFDEPLSGTVVVVAPDSISVPTVTAGRIEAGAVVITTNGITINGVPVLTEQSLAAQIAAGVTATFESKADAAALQAETAARAAGDAANAAALAAEAARAQMAESVLAANIASKVTASQAAAAAPVQTVFGRSGDVVLQSSDVTEALGYSPLDATALAAEATQRSSGDLSNAQAIASEISRAQTAEAALSSAIALKASQVDLDALTTVVTTKVTAAQAAAEAPVQSVAGRTGNVVLTASDVSGLSNVATSGSYADLSGVPTALSAFTNDAGFQTGSQVDARVQQVVGAAPAALDTLAEIASQLAADESAVAALTSVVATKASQSALDAEQAARQAGDAANAAAVATETSARAAADVALGGRIDTLEGVVATKASQAALSAESTARAEADAVLGSSITSEATARAAADTALDGRIDTLTGVVATKVTAAQAAAAAPVQSVAGRTGNVTLTASDVSGLSSVATSGAYADLSGKPTALSQFANDTGFATTSQVDARVQAVVGAAPAALDTLAEIASQLAADESAFAALTNVVATKVTAAQAAAAAPVQSVGGRTGHVALLMPIGIRGGGSQNISLSTGAYALRNRSGGFSNVNFY